LIKRISGIKPIIDPSVDIVFHRIKPFFFGKSKWFGNYWNRPRLLPKPIFGIMAKMPWLNFDWRTQRAAYDILLT